MTGTRLKLMAALAQMIIIINTILAMWDLLPIVMLTGFQKFVLIMATLSIIALISALLYIGQTIEKSRY